MQYPSDMLNLGSSIACKLYYVRKFYHLIDICILYYTQLYLNTHINIATL